MRIYGVLLLALFFAFSGSMNVAAAQGVEVNLDVLDAPDSSASGHAPLPPSSASAEQARDEGFTAEALRKKYGLDSWEPPETSYMMRGYKGRGRGSSSAGSGGDAKPSVAVAVPAPQVIKEAVFVPVPIPLRKPAVPALSVKEVVKKETVKEKPAVQVVAAPSPQEPVPASAALKEAEVTLPEPELVVAEAPEYLPPVAPRLDNAAVSAELLAIEMAEAALKEGRENPEDIDNQGAFPEIDRRGDVVGSIVFQHNDIRLDQFEDKRMQDEYLLTLKARPANRIAIYAYAGIEGRDEKKARRISLSRALQVRNYLTENGVSGQRIDLFPQGYEAGALPVDRVDIVLQ